MLNCVLVQAASLSVVVTDPKGIAVPGASVAAEGKSHFQAVTDASGHAQFDSIPPGSYRVSAAKDGFEPWERMIAVADKPVQIAISLKLAVVTTTLQVSGKRSPLANSDPNYTALRRGKLSRVYRVNNLILKRDVGTFTFRSGSFSFLPPVLGQIATGVFVGDGNLQLKPAYHLAIQHLHRVTGADAVDEDFSGMVVYFSDATFDEIKLASEIVDESTDRHEAAFKRVKDVIEHRRNPPSPLARNCCPPLKKWGLTMLERLMNNEDIPNYEAEVLAELYNRPQSAYAPASGSFRAFLHGKKHPDLRFLLNPHGAMPMLPAPEEIALLNFEPTSDLDGIWYLSHFASELAAGHASSNEDKRMIAAEHYRIETVIGRENFIGKQPDLAVTCDLRFRTLQDGTRMVKFDLVPDLQVTRVSWEGREIPFVQESRKNDGSFYLQMPEALVRGRVYQVTFEYGGGEILESEWGMVPSRRVWYPTPAGAANRATYDLTFRAPVGSTIVTAGHPVRQAREGSFEVSQWVSDVPITQAVFRYLADASHKSAIDEPTNTSVSMYVAAGGRGFLPPSAGDMMKDTGNALRVFNSWFGKPAYDSLSVVVAVGSPFDSLPGVVIAPPVAMAGYGSVASQVLVMSGGRGRALGSVARTFLDEAFPKAVAQQWWGNTLTPASFHDVWLASGFANFSGSLYDAATQSDEYKDHWVTARETLLNRNEFGVRPNDAGPLWMGILNESEKTAGSGFRLATMKGSYILQMLRSIMWEPVKNGDDDFRAMMHDYVRQFVNQSVSTGDFQGLVEKHMKPPMDLTRNGRMDWFFSEWVYGTDVPSYRMEYKLTPDKSGKSLLTGKLTQSGVSPAFAMPVPLFAELGGRKMRVAVMQMFGNSTGDFKVLLSETPKHVLLNLNHDVLTDKEEVKRVK